MTDRQTSVRDRQSQKADRGILFALVLLTAFLGQVYFRPFSEHFRFSLAVPALVLLLLYFPHVSAIAYSLIAGFTMLAFRTLLTLLSQMGGPFLPALAENLPSSLFYLVFGVLFVLLDIRGRRQKPLQMFLALWVCEVAANLAELLAIWNSNTLPLDQAVTLVVLVGGIRCGCVVAIYRLSVYYFTRYERRNREERYTSMLLLFSSIKTDLLFFHKSARDIEDAMQRSYSIYERAQDDALREDALSVARGIHEVKKDYGRISASIEQALSEEYQPAPMRVAEVFDTLQRSTDRLLDAKHAPVTVTFACRDDWVCVDFFAIFSIVNNLVVNAIEAIGQNGAGGKVEVSHQLEGEAYQLEVWDNGPGIPADQLDYVFEPGFTTKFDPETGAMSSGLGLVQVKYLAEQFFGGSFRVASVPGNTRFTVVLPVRTVRIAKNTGN